MREKSAQATSGCGEAAMLQRYGARRGARHHDRACRVIFAAVGALQNRPEVSRHARVGEDHVGIPPYDGAERSAEVEPGAFVDRHLHDARQAIFYGILDRDDVDGLGDKPVRTSPPPTSGLPIPCLY